MADEKRVIRYEDARMSRAHYHSAKIEEILDDLENGKIEPQTASCLLYTSDAADDL